MSFTIGTALSIVAFLFGMAFSAWALLIGSALIFRHKAEISLGLIKHCPGRTFFLGAVSLFVVGFLSIVFLGLPLPIAKLVGYSGVLFVLSFAALGGGGLVLLAAERVREVDPRTRGSVALNRAALYIVAAGLVPLLGLFVIFPAVLAIGLGAGLQALFMSEAPAQEAAPSSL